MTSEWISLFDFLTLYLINAYSTNEFSGHRQFDRFYLAGSLNQDIYIALTSSTSRGHQNVQIMRFNP